MSCDTVESMNAGIPGERDPGAGGPPRWLLLIHQIPPKPAYLRVRIGRRLQGLGAVALKNTVYALPRSDAAQEDLAWVLREISEAGGEAVLVAATLLEGLRDQDLEALFQAARSADYARISERARKLAATLRAKRAPRCAGSRRSSRERLRSTSSRRPAERQRRDASRRSPRASAPARPPNPRPARPRARDPTCGRSPARPGSRAAASTSTGSRAPG